MFFESFTKVGRVSDIVLTLRILEYINVEHDVAEILLPDIAI